MEEQKQLDPVERLQQLERRGAYFEAADLASRLLLDYVPGTGEADAPAEDTAKLHTISFLHVLVVARSGAIETAKELYQKYRIGDRRTEDAQGLRARLMKDDAFESKGEMRAELLRKAADAYAQVYEEFGGGFPAVNAATLNLLAGQEDAAMSWAQKTLNACAQDKSERERKKYYRDVSIAEAQLVRGDMEAAEAALKQAGAYENVDFGAHATTAKQLKLVCEARGLDASVLKHISVPDILYFAGHIISPPGAEGRFPATQEDHVRTEINRYLREHRPSVAYGSLAAGADILFAEACIEADIELIVVLPFNLEDFVAQSVASAGADWVERFNRCLAWFDSGTGRSQRGITYATEGKFLQDESLYMYGAQLAMGLALLRASGLGTGMRMAVVYDGLGGNGVGTDGSIEMWEELGLPYHIIDCPGSRGPAPPREAPVADTRRIRHPRAILFGDVVGFSKLKEEDVPRFHDVFMARISQELKSFGEHVLYRNSWGDALYVVFDGAVEAARFSLSLQKVIDDMKFMPVGAEVPLRLRLGGHFGPIYQGVDQLCEVETYYGSHVTRAARIEPVTPEGKVYVTEPMAAALALADVRDIDCDYVGPVPLAKDYGEIRMYQLRERG